MLLFSFVLTKVIVIVHYRYVKPLVKKVRPVLTKPLELKQKGN